MVKWLRSGKGQRFLVMISFMTAPLLLLFVFTYLPFFKMIEFSFYDMKYIGAREFVGLDNYKDVLTDKEVMNSLKLSLYYLIGSFVQLALALYFATMLSFKTKGGSFFKGTIFFPYLISGIAMGFMFKFFYTREFVFDTVLTWIGFNLESLPYWLRDKSVNNIALVATSIWKYMGQNMVLFIGAIMSVDRELYESASLDGANRWHQFRYIILPSIKTIVVLNMILSITGSLSAFEPPFVITGGRRGTSTFFLLMHNMAHGHQKVGKASAMALILFTLIIFVTIAQKLIFKYAFSDNNADVSKKTARMLKKQRAKEAK
ncbi:MAG: sugar ABC transporter permease [Clostridiales bacterium]|nr:sugar ABC transporter permease [Clostridiales bacterium]